MAGRQASGVGWTKLLPPSDLLEKISGIEDGLKDNRKAGRLGTAGLLFASLQLALGFSSKLPGDLLKGWAPWVTELLVSLGVFLLVTSTLLVARSRLWIRESTEPFNYTCSLVKFTALGKVARDDFSEVPVWLKYDLAEMLNERIGRLSFVDKARPEAGPPSGGAGEHIKISGELLVRRKADRSWVIEVTPRVQVGGENAPATLGHPVQFVCPEIQAPPAKAEDLLQTSARETSVDVSDRPTAEVMARDAGTPSVYGPKLAESDYEKIVERVYFSVASQIYRQIQKDVRRKIGLLPTRFLKATAYYHEAHDYERSNTLDALDAARELFQSAMHLYDPRLRPVPERKLRRPYLVFLQWKTRVIVPGRVRGAKLWPRLARGEVMAARAEIGYADTLLYRRTLAGLSGHRMNSVYEARPVAQRAILRLGDVPFDVPGCRQVCFDAQVTHALACYQLELTGAAKDSLDQARSLIPNRFDDDARYLYVAGMLEPRARLAIRFLRQAVERQPRFEVAQFELAQRMEMMWRARPTLEPSVAEMIQFEYSLVLKLNPGNLRAWGNMAYVHWLLGDLEKAAEAYERGRDYKLMKRDARVAALEYGLARVAAEQGRCDVAYRHYLSATSAQVLQGVSDKKWTSAQFYFFDFIGGAIMDRFIKYFVTATMKCADDDTDGANKDRFREIVRSFVHNDYGEACHTYHIRNCSKGALEEAKANYGEAKSLNPDAILPHYNLHLLRMYEGETGAAMEELELLRKLEPNWPDYNLAWVAAKAQQTRDIGTGRSDGCEPEDGHQRPAAVDGVTGEPAGAVDDKEALRCLRILLPHDWLWKTDNQGVVFDYRAAFRSDHNQAMRWERELEDLHVRSLFLWTVGPLVDDNLKEERLALLNCIRTHFWPGNYDVLLCSYLLDRKVLFDDIKDDMHETMQWWIDTDPTAFWALEQVTSDIDDPRRKVPKLFSDEERWRYLDAAARQLPEGSELGLWIKGKLEETIRAEAGPAV